MKRRACVAILLAVLLLVMLPPALALADAPITRGPEPAGQGSVGVPPTGAGGVSDSTSWRGVQELPPPSMPPQGAIAAPAYAPRLQQGGEGDGALAWLDRQINPGNWILDAGMGIFAGIVKMFGGMMQKAAEAFLGTASVLPSGCDNAATNFVFCTPAGLTYAHPGVQAVWGILRSIATSLVTLLFTVRLGRMIVEGPRSLATEGKGLLLTFICSMAFIQATGAICMLLVEFFNGLSNLLLSRASLALPSQDVGDLNIGSNILFLVLWVLILLLVLKGFSRIVQIIILIAMAPIAGALLIDRSTSSRFRSWFEKLIELLLAQIGLVIIFIMIAAILQPYQNQGAGDAFVGFLLSIVMMGMALNGRAVIGVAGTAMSGGGGGIVSFLRYQLAGNILRGRRRAGGGSGTGSGRTSAEGIDPQVQHAAQTAREGSTRASGDPAQSAAAQRQSTSRSAGTSNDAASPHGSFRLGDAGDGLSSRRATARYQAAAQVPRGLDGRLLDGARREQALMRATLMRQRASELRGQGERPGADVLDHKARTHERFGRGQDIARPSRFSGVQREQRRTAYRQALAEVGGMHALERDTLTQQIGQDEERLPTLQRELAMAGARGGDTTGLHREQHELTTRLEQNRARLQLLTPKDGEHTPRITRASAAALANERLPQELRSRDYALRHGADRSSAFVKRIANAPTQDARDDLAKTRAHAVRMAQTPTDGRPPIAPTRRRQSEAGKRKDAAPRPRAEGGASSSQSPTEGEPTRPSRARSETIARLRAQRAQGGEPPDPIAPDTPRQKGSFLSRVREQRVQGGEPPDPPDPVIPDMPRRKLKFSRRRDGDGKERK